MIEGSNIEPVVASFLYSGPPISQVPPDVLLAIINLNISDFASSIECDIPPDLLLQSYSQVCMEWRSVILASPFLWRKVIWIDDDGPWLNEVVRRTCSAPVWICGDCDYTTFIGFVSRHWSRTERLSVAVHQFDIVRAEKDLKFLYTPAPKLVYCKVRLIGLKRSRVATHLTDLFGGAAPNLRVLKAPHLLFGIPTAVSWLTRMKVMELPNSFTVSDVLNALSHMSLVEDISVRISPIDTPLRISHIQLHRLRRLRIHGDLFGILAVMEILKPGPGCSVIVSTTARLPPSNTQLPLAYELVPRYMNNCFGGHPAAAIRLTFIDKSMTYCAAEGSSEFSISLDHWMEVIMAIAGLTGCRHFAEVITLHLGVFSLELGLRPLLRSLATSSFQSVTCLDVYFNHEILEIIAPTISEIPFPALKTVRINPFYQAFDIDNFDKDLRAKHQNESLFKFIKGRRSWDCPISVLDLCFLTEKDYIALECLDTVIGLRVQWYDVEGHVCEYLCGSGIETIKQSRLKTCTRLATL